MDDWLTAVELAIATAATALIAPQLIPLVDGAILSSLPADAIILEYLASAAIESGATAILTQQAVGALSKTAAHETFDLLGIDHPSSQSLPSDPAEMPNKVPDANKPDVVSDAPLPMGNPLTSTPRAPPPIRAQGFLGHSDSIRIPFSSEIARFTNDGAFHYVVASQLANSLGPFRFAVLERLEAVFFPNRNAHAVQFDLGLAWTSADTPNITDEEAIFNVPVSTKVVFSENVTAIAPAIFACPLSGVNPIIKDSIPYTDHPKLHAVFRHNGGQTPSPGSMVLRGIIRVSDPKI